MSSDNETSRSLAWREFKQSDHPFDRIHRTPAFRAACITICVRAFESLTTIEPNPMYTIFFSSALAFAMNEIAGGILLFHGRTTYYAHLQPGAEIRTAYRPTTQHI